MSKFSNFLHTIGSSIGHVLGDANGHITIQSVIDHAEDLIKIANFYNGVHSAIKGITDPAKVIEAACTYAIAHQNDLPASMVGSEFEHNLILICQKVSGLPLDRIEELVKIAIAHK